MLSLASLGFNPLAMRQLCHVVGNMGHTGVVPQAHKHTKHTLCFTIDIGQTLRGILQKQLS